MPTNREYNQAYYQAHKEDLKAAVRSNYAANRQARLAYAKKYRESHREQVTRTKSDWAKKHRQELNAKRRNNPKTKEWDRLQRIKRGDRIKGQVDPHIWKNLIEHFGNCCAYCGETLPIEMDHFVPLSKGGDHINDNLLPACRSCNASKGNKLFEEWRPQEAAELAAFIAEGLREV